MTDTVNVALGFKRVESFPAQNKTGQPKGHGVSHSKAEGEFRMCGRYTLLAQANELAAEFGIVEAGNFVPRYNVAPSQDVPVIRVGSFVPESNMTVVRQSEAGGTRRLDILRWGLIPHWAKDPKIAFRTINARGETVATQPAFRNAFKMRRCIVPANGFYEWQRLMKGGKEVKQPLYIRRGDGRVLALAGLWERWEGPDGKVVESFTIITTEANEFIREFHNRMPVILRPEDYDLWLNPASKPDQLKSLLTPCPPEWLVAMPVSQRVNSPRNDDPSCIDELS